MAPDNDDDPLKKSATSGLDFSTIMQQVPGMFKQIVSQTQGPKIQPRQVAQIPEIPEQPTQTTEQPAQTQPTGSDTGSSFAQMIPAIAAGVAKVMAMPQRMSITTPSSLTTTLPYGVTSKMASDYHNRKVAEAKTINDAAAQVSEISNQQAALQQKAAEAEADRELRERQLQQAAQFQQQNLGLQRQHLAIEQFQANEAAQHNAADEANTAQYRQDSISNSMLQMMFGLLGNNMQSEAAIRGHEIAANATVEAAKIGADSRSDEKRLENQRRIAYGTLEQVKDALRADPTAMTDYTNRYRSLAGERLFSLFKNGHIDWDVYAPFMIEAGLDPKGTLAAQHNSAAPVATPDPATQAKAQAAANAAAAAAAAAKSSPAQKSKDYNNDKYFGQGEE
jgi:hypothetical protein